jgi:hypothetical protein
MNLTDSSKIQKDIDRIINFSVLCIISLLFVFKYNLHNFLHFNRLNLSFHLLLCYVKNKLYFLLH